MIQHGSIITTEKLQKFCPSLLSSHVYMCYYLFVSVDMHEDGHVVEARGGDQASLKI